MNKKKNQKLLLKLLFSTTSKFFAKMSNNFAYVQTFYITFCKLKIVFAFLQHFVMVKREEEAIGPFHLT